MNVESGGDPHGVRGSDGEDEDLLIEDEALSYAGPWARPGTLRLTSTTLEHSPSGTLDRMVGADEVVLPIRDIDGVDLSGLDRLLVVRAQGRTWRFGGAGARRVYARLLALLDERDGTTDPGNRRFLSGERVLLHGPMNRLLSGPLGTRGHLALTDLRLRFEAGRGLERLLWSDVGFDLLIDRIRGVSLRGVRRNLVIHTDDGILELSGTLGPRFHQELVSRVGDPTAPTPPPTAPEAAAEVPALLAAWEVSVRAGPLVHPGTLQVGPDALRFVPDSGLGVAMGIQGATLPLQDIHRLRLYGWPDRRIVISAGAQRLVLMLPDAAERFEDLLHLLRQALMLRASADIDGMVATRRAVWGRTQGWADAPVVAADPALERLGEGDWQVGLVVVTAERLVFAPSGPADAGTAEHSYPLRSLVRRQASAPELVDQLRFGVGAAQVTLWPVSGRPFVRSLWKRAQPPVRVVPWEEAGTGTHTRLDGPVRFVRARTEGRVICELHPSRAFLRADGWGVVLPGPAAERLHHAPLIDLEVGQPEGVYRFEVRPVGVTFVPSDFREELPTTARLLLTTRPTTLRVYNQRSRFRVPLGLPAMASAQRFDTAGRPLGDTDFRVVVEDLSTRGLTLRSPLRLARGARVTVHLMVDGLELALPARVLRQDAAGEGSADLRYGLRLDGLTQGQDEQLHRLVMGRQRELLTAKAASLARGER